MMIRYVAPLFAVLGSTAAQATAYDFSFRDIADLSVLASGRFTASGLSDAGYIPITSIAFNKLQDQPSGIVYSGRFADTGLLPGAAYNPVSGKFINRPLGDYIYNVGSFTVQGLDFSTMTMISTTVDGSTFGEAGFLATLKYAGKINSDQLTFISVTQAVPEPANWAMMIIGFGATGAVARTGRRRQTERLTFCLVVMNELPRRSRHGCSIVRLSEHPPQTMFAVAAVSGLSAFGAGARETGPSFSSSNSCFDPESGADTHLRSSRTGHSLIAAIRRLKASSRR